MAQPISASEVNHGKPAAPCFFVEDARAVHRANGHLMAKPLLTVCQIKEHDFCSAKIHGVIHVQYAERA
jgi:hypothetical protein